MLQNKLDAKVNLIKKNVNDIIQHCFSEIFHSHNLKNIIYLKNN